MGSLCSSGASYGYGGSGKAYIIPGTEPRVITGVYKQKYMQPVFITSYVPVHHEQHASPVQYVAVAPTSGYHHAPAPAVHASALSGHGYSGVSHGHTVAPVVSYGYSPVYQLARSAPMKFTPSHEHGSSSH